MAEQRRPGCFRASRAPRSRSFELLRGQYREAELQSPAMAKIPTRKEAQIVQLQRAADVQEASRLAGVTKEAAILNALVVEESNEMVESAAKFVGNALEQNGTATIEASKLLAERVDGLSSDIRKFTKQADDGTRRLANWTIVLAVATVFLFLATVALVVVSFKAEPPQAQIVVVPSPLIGPR